MGPGERKLDRNEAISLLLELTQVFESLSSVPIVSITKDKESGNWELLVSWVAGSLEKASLKSIAAKHGAKVIEEEGYTVFR
jgi:hypothetical protein